MLYDMEIQVGGRAHWRCGPVSWWQHLRYANRRQLRWKSIPVWYYYTFQGLLCIPLNFVETSMPSLTAWNYGGNFMLPNMCAFFLPPLGQRVPMIHVQYLYTMFQDFILVANDRFTSSWNQRSHLMWFSSGCLRGRWPKGAPWEQGGGEAGVWLSNMLRCSVPLLWGQIAECLWHAGERNSHCLARSAKFSYTLILVQIHVATYLRWMIEIKLAGTFQHDLQLVNFEVSVLNDWSALWQVLFMRSQFRGETILLHNLWRALSEPGIVPTSDLPQVERIKMQGEDLFAPDKGGSYEVQVLAFVFWTTVLCSNLFLASFESLPMHFVFHENHQIYWVRAHISSFYSCLFCHPHLELILWLSIPIHCGLVHSWKLATTWLPVSIELIFISNVPGVGEPPIGQKVGCALCSRSSIFVQDEGNVGQCHDKRLSEGNFCQTHWRGHCIEGCVACKGIAALNPEMT